MRIRSILLILGGFAVLAAAITVGVWAINRPTEPITPLDDPPATRPEPDSAPPPTPPNSAGPA